MSKKRKYGRITEDSYHSIKDALKYKRSTHIVFAEAFGVSTTTIYHIKNSDNFDHYRELSQPNTKKNKVSRVRLTLRKLRRRSTAR